ncbi:unnamed protein product [Clavelina lepadiformis]|uniref:Uncharacterized protein n=1 Tax=Clavelina lepadiformis TaxID=159417 RepID=A0ABP0G6T2_CLALP
MGAILLTRKVTGSMKASRLETPSSKSAQYEYYLRSRKFNNKRIEMAGICGQNLTRSGPSRPHGPSNATELQPTTPFQQIKLRPLSRRRRIMV